jgi:zinc transporter 1/2/3
MILNTLSLAALAITGAYAQSSRTTYTGCSTETVDGSAIYGCFGPDGARTPFSTQALSTPASSAAAATGQTTAVTDCTASATDNIQCVNGAGSTVRVLHTATATDSAPAEYTQCHSHSADETYVTTTMNDTLHVLTDSLVFASHQMAKMSKSSL